MADKYTNGYQRDADWVALVFSNQGLPRGEVESLLVNDKFPHDYPDLRYLDFMLLPVVLLRWQVEQITTRLTFIKAEIMNQDKNLVSPTQDENLVFPTIEKVSDMRNKVFKMQQSHVMLHRRWTFARELTDNLARCFDKIEKRNSKENNVMEYSATFRDIVQAQDDILKTLLHDLDTTLSRIQAQQTNVSKRRLGVPFEILMLIL